MQIKKNSGFRSVNVSVSMEGNKCKRSKSNHDLHFEESPKESFEATTFNLSNYLLPL